jgi:Na+/phosphate symporter
MQNKRESFTESVVNVAIGYLISLAGQLVIFPMVGISATLGQNLLIGVGFTVISIARQYAVRRWFNARGRR